MNTEATEASAPIAQPQQNGSTKTADVLVAVFFTLAGVAIAAIIAVLIYSAVNNRIKSSGVSREDPDDPDDNADETEKDSGEDREDGSAEDDESEEDGDEDDEDNED
jgi:hypothetical protein